MCFDLLRRPPLHAAAQAELQIVGASGGRQTGTVPLPRVRIVGLATALLTVACLLVLLWVGQRKLIYQSPWYERGEYRGFVELSLPIPAVMPHFKRGE